MRVRPLAFVFLALGSLSGCAPPLALRPDDGSSVTIEFVEERNVVGGNGHVSVFMDDFDCYGFSKDGTSNSKMPVTKTFLTPGRKYLTIGVQYFAASMASVRSCLTNYTFPIVSGARYRVAIGNDGKTCSTRVSRLSADSEAAGTPLQVVSRDRLRPATDSQGPWCREDRFYMGSSSLALPRGK